MSSTTDKISALPDSLLYHILSFLPVKSAVTTSVLSKRWKPLWQLALTLDFDDERFTDFARFRHLAYSVIMRDPALPIRSFRISCGKSENFDPRDLNQNCDDPSCEFNGFPKLMRAKFSGELQHFPFAWFRTAEYLHLELFRAYQNTVPIFHNLTHIELVFHSNDWEGTKWKWVIQVLQHCPKLQNFTIDEANKYEEVNDNEVWKDPKTIPECLLSQLRTCCLPDFRGIQCELQFAKYILANSKLLNIVTIKINCNCDENKTLEILEKFSASTRGSPTCRVFFD